MLQMTCPAPDDFDPHLPPVDEVLAEEASAPSGRVLVIEDDEDVRVAIVEVLLLSGYDVHAASSGREALAILRAIPIDVAIVDMTLPDTDGATLARRIAAGPSRPAVVVASGASRVAELARAVGTDLWLEKPFGIESLLDRVERALGHALPLD